MSAFVGKYLLDGKPAGRGEIHRMISTMAHRAPDGLSVWHAGPVGLGHGMLYTTPESLVEALPLTSASGRATITADARIDNRSELLQTLRLPARTPSYADSELILAAYERWGEDCVDHLVGDFAFAIWDDVERKLFCGRDHFGIRAFYYHHLHGRHFVCATEIKALLTQENVPERLNEERLGDYLAGIAGDAESTIYVDIRRLPAGHVLTIDERGLRTRRYYELQPSEDVGSDWSDDAYAERFHELFDEAVRCRTRSAFPVGSELSGGLDSSYVTCVARDVLREEGRDPLHTFSGIFEELHECDERPYIESVVETGGVTPHYVVSDGARPLSILEEIYDYVDDGVVGGSHHLVWGLYRAVAQSGVRVHLDGIDGDRAVDHGHYRFFDLARAADWDRFVTEAVAAAGRFHSADHRHPFEDTLASDPRILRTYGFPVFDEILSTGDVVRFLKSARAMRKRVRFGWRDVLGSFGKRYVSAHLLNRSKEPYTVPDYIDADFAARAGIKDRALDDPLQLPSRSSMRERHAAILRSSRMAGGHELQDQVAGIFGFEVRHPFRDKRLLEYCISLPPEQSLSNGWTRAVLRRAMDGVVPSKVTWRVGKGRMSASGAHGLFELDGPLLEEYVERLGVIEPYIDTTALRRRMEQGRDLAESERVNLSQVAILSYWMNRRFGRQGSIHRAATNRYTTTNYGPGKLPRSEEEVGTTCR